MSPKEPVEQTHQRASKMAQLLGEIIVHHAPWTSEIAEQTRRRITDDWLEGLEAHASKVVSPLIDQVLAASDPPAEVVELLGHAKSPSAQFGATIQQFFVYGVMFSLASTALAPFTQGLANDIWKAHPDRPISPADLATMVVRGIAPGDAPTTVAPGWAMEIANESGLSDEYFQALVSATGNPPAMEMLFQMIRRGIIDESTLQKGIKEGDTRDEWIDPVSKLRYVEISPQDLVRAAVQEQLDYATANDWAIKVGLEPPGYLDDNPDWFRILFDVAGRPPGPVEMGHAANRGIIPWAGTGPDALTFQQAIAESDIKTKWTPILQKLAEYFPPPGEVRTLLMHGGITEDQAIELWKQGGIPDTLATAYAHIAQVEQITQDRQLTKQEIMEALQESLISETEAESALNAIGYRGDTAATLLKLGQWRYNMQTLRTAVRRVSSLYTTFKITATETVQALEAIGLPNEQAKALLSTLEAQRDAEVITLTTAQVTDAFEYAIVTQTEAMTYLEQLGYRPWDAWVRLSIKNKGPLPDEPPRPGIEGGNG